MFFAAFRSRSWVTPHSTQVHSLIPRPALPLGLLLGFALQHEQVWVVFASSTISNHTPAFAHLYLSMVFNLPQLASKTDLASLVFAKAWAIIALVWSI